MLWNGGEGGEGCKTLTPHHASGEILDYTSEQLSGKRSVRDKTGVIGGARREYIMYIYYLQNHNGEVC